MKDYDESKLPNWAQRRLSGLRQRVRDLEAAAATQGRDPKSARFVIENFSLLPDQALPDNAKITLRDLGDDNYQLRVTPTGVDDELGFEIMGIYGGFCRMAVVPVASNVVVVKLVPAR